MVDNLSVDIIQIGLPRLSVIFYPFVVGDGSDVVFGLGGFIDNFDFVVQIQSDAAIVRILQELLFLVPILFLAALNHAVVLARVVLVFGEFFLHSEFELDCSISFAPQVLSLTRLHLEGQLGHRKCLDFEDILLISVQVESI